MSFVPNENFRREFSRGDVEPVVKLEVEVTMRQFLRVLNFANGSDDELIVATTESSIFLTEGVDFDAEISNLVTAQNIRDALNARAELRGRLVARIDDLDASTVEIIWLNPLDFFDIVLSQDDSAWTVVRKRPYQSAAIDVESLTGTGTVITINLDTFSFTYPLISNANNDYTFLAGTNFTVSSTSRDTTAISLAAAINSHGTLGTMMFAYASGRRVWLRAYDTSIRRMIVSSDDETHFSVPQTARYAVTWISGTRNLFGYCPSITSFTVPKRSKNALTQEHSVSEGSVRMVDDGEMRHFMSRYMMKGATCRYHIGVPSLSEADFQVFPPMLLDEVLQDSTGSIEVTLVDILGALRDIQSRVRHGGIHPLESAEQVLRIALPEYRTGGDDVADSWFNFDTFDFSLYPDRSHFMVARADQKYRTFEPNGVEINGFETYDRRMSEAEPALDMLNELLLCADGSLQHGEDGRYEFIPLDLGAAADHTWAVGADDGYDSTVLVQKSALDSVISEVTMSHCGGQAKTSLKSQDAFLAARFSFQVTLDSPWINALSHKAPEVFGGEYVIRDLINNSPEFVIERAQRFGFCGTGGMIAGSVSRDSSTRLLNETNRPGFFRIHSAKSQNPSLADDAFEIVAIKSATVVNNSNDLTNIPTISAGNNQDQWIEFAFADTYEDSQLGFDSASDGRGGLGTTTPVQWGSENHTLDRVWFTDVTIPFFIARQRLERFKFGAPVLVLRVGLDKIGVQLGDVVALTGDELFLGFLMDGADSNIFFEVTSVQEMFFEDSPGIEVELTFLRREDVQLTPGYAADPGDGSFSSDTQDPDAGEVVDNDGEFVWIDDDADTIMDTPVVISTD